MLAVVIVFVTWIIFTLLIFFALHYLFPTQEVQSLSIIGTWIDGDRNIYILTETEFTIGLKEDDEYVALVEKIKIVPLKNIHWLIPGLRMRNFMLVGEDVTYRVSVLDSGNMELSKGDIVIAELSREVV